MHALARIAAPVRVHCYGSAFSGISFQLWCGKKCSPASVCGSALSLVSAGQRSVVCLRRSPVSSFQASATLRACVPRCKLYVLDLVVVVNEYLRSGLFVCPREEVPDIVHKSAHK